MPRLDPDQQQLLSALESLGLQGLHVLDIGCGRGHLHRPLLQAGANSITGIEIQAGYLTDARDNALAHGLTDRLRYVEGDYLDLSSSLPGADVTLLDKAVHCYEAPEALIRTASRATGKYLAVTFPRNRLWFRALLGTAATLIRCLPPSWRPGWRVRFTTPERIRSWIREEGLETVSAGETALFYTEVFARGGGRS